MRSGTGLKIKELKTYVSGFHSGFSGLGTYTHDFRPVFIFPCVFYAPVAAETNHFYYSAFNAAPKEKMSILTKTSDDPWSKTEWKKRICGIRNLFCTRAAKARRRFEQWEPDSTRAFLSFRFFFFVPFFLLYIHFIGTYYDVHSKCIQKNKKITINNLEIRKIKLDRAGR